MMNFREEFEQLCCKCVKMQYLNGVESVLSRLLDMLKYSSTPIEILSVREVVIYIFQKEGSLLHIQAKCKTYKENECIINEDISNTEEESLEYLKLVTEFVLRTQKLPYTIEYKPIVYDNITPKSYPSYEITFQL